MEVSARITLTAHHGVEHLRAHLSARTANRSNVLLTMERVKRDEKNAKKTKPKGRSPLRLSNSVLDLRASLPLLKRGSHLQDPIERVHINSHGQRKASGRFLVLALQRFIFIQPLQDHRHTHARAQYILCIIARRIHGNLSVSQACADLGHLEIGSVRL